MSYVTITSPRQGARRPIIDGVLAAFGRADEGVIGVVGTCTPKGGAGAGRPIKGTLMDFRRATSKEGKCCYQWVIGFKLDPAEYELKVVGHSESGPVASATVEIGPPHGSPHAPSSTVFSPLVLQAGDPASSDNMSADLCSGNFCPWGPMTDDSALDPTSVELVLTNPAVSPAPTVTPTSAGGNAGDPFWWAVFPAVTEPLESGDTQEIFTLHLEDTDGNPLDITGLVMDFPCS